MIVSATEWIREKTVEKEFLEKKSLTNYNQQYWK